MKQTVNTTCTIQEKQLELLRYPEFNQNPSWQAWDAADELLIEHMLEQTLPSDSRMHIANDDFGAIACWLNDYDCSWQTDSKVSELGCLANLARNQLSTEHLTLVPSMEVPPKADWVLLKIPKNQALLEQQLIQLQSVVSPDTRIVASGKVKAIQRSTLALFEKHLGSTTTSLAKKKARLIFCQPDVGRHSQNPYPTVWHTEHPAFRMANHANVFARQQLDIGARFLLEHLPEASNLNLIDLGCGNGILGLSMLARYPECQVQFVDESQMALASAQENVEANLGPEERQNRCQFHLSNCLEQVPKQNVDLILCNPPFHQQNGITEHIARQMFKEAKQYLRVGGELRIVANRHLDYPKQLKRLFGGFRIVASSAKFVILSCIRTR